MRDHDPPFYHRVNNYAYSRAALTTILSLSLVVAIVTILHIYARCVLRRQDRGQASVHRPNIITSPVEPPKTGLAPSAIAALPIFIFKQTNDAGNEMKCSVCLNGLQDGEIAKTLPNCKHTFHEECIDKWFGSSTTCPICRTEAEPRLVAEPRERAVTAVGAPPSAPPMLGTSDGGDTQSSAVAKFGGSNLRLSSFRRILGRERSSRRMQIQSSGRDDGLPDLERQ